MSSVYKRLNWADKELLTSYKLNDMVGNADWLYENMITGYYDVNGLVRDSGLTMRCGYVSIPNSSDTGLNITNYYSKPFLPGAKPVVVTSWVTDSYIGVTTGIKALDGTAIPDHRGFLCLIFDAMKVLNVGAGDFKGSTYQSFIAVAPNG